VTGAEAARVALVDDEPVLLRLVALQLEAAGYHVTTFPSPTEALRALDEQTFHVLVTDVMMSEMSGLELCERVVANHREIPVIVLTASNKLETAVAAIRVGAYDFITKPINPEALVIAVARAVEHRRLRSEVAVLRRAVAASQKFDELIGGSDPMREVYAAIERFAASDATVLITGESGTGKEVVARALHRNSKRKAGPMIAVNCAAIPDTMLESELFGHERGAFTDARAARPGLFVQADGGTLFLDEIGELPLTLQPKLLRALEERSVRPLGATHEVKFDTRVIVATNRDLETAVEEKRFREDLYYRINVLHIGLPPLRARGRDVLAIAQSFIERFAGESGKSVRGMSPPAATRMLGYSWPGNVRELRNCIERAVALAAGEELLVDDLPEKVREQQRAELVLPSSQPDELVPMEEVERRYILRVLETLGGNKRQAAKILGFDRRTLYRKLEKYGVAASDED
jgi:two-component system, NtrC family, response regulator AtoC